MVIKNSHFKLLANNITPSTFEEFFLKIIKNNIKVDAPFFYSLIREVSDIKKINVANSNKNISATTPLVKKNKKNC